MNLLTGPRPDLTPAQIVSAVPVLGAMAAAATPGRRTDEQIRVLRGAMAWSAALVVADALLRVGRGVAARPPAAPPAPADLMGHPDAAASDAFGPPVGLGEEEVVLDPATESYADDDLEPVPGVAEEPADAEKVDIDPDLTRTGEVDDEAGKPVAFR
jgi:hypothetical protein